MKSIIKKAGSPILFFLALSSAFPQMAFSSAGGGPFKPLNEVAATTQRGGKVDLLLDAGVTAVPLTSDISIFSTYLSHMYQGGISYEWGLPFNYNGNVTLTSKGRLGGEVCKTMTPETIPGSLEKLSVLKIKEDVIGGLGLGAELLHPNLTCNDPALFDSNGTGILPIICPRIASQRYLYGKDLSINPNVVTDPSQDYYIGSLDTKNNPPQDVFENGTDSSFNCKSNNILKIEKVTTQYDWEDDGELTGVEKGTGEKVYEINGGAYSNFHYAVMPCNSFYDEQYNNFVNYIHPGPNLPVLVAPPAGYYARMASELMHCANENCSPKEQKAYQAMQFFLHLGAEGLGETDLQGNAIGLDEINQADKMPSLKLHSLLPGSFWTKNDNGYDQCEWLDTSGLAPVQTVNYQDFGIWDWSATPDSCVNVVVWEGDGNQTKIFRGSAIGPTDIADDLVGVFKVKRSQTIGSHSIQQTNYSGDLKITFSTGKTKCHS